MVNTELMASQVVMEYQKETRTVTQLLDQLEFE